MAIQLSTNVRNAMVDTYDTTIGTTARLYLYTGASPPSSCAAADAGTTLALLTLPATYVGAGSNGTVSIANGPWTGTGLAAGTAGHYRIKDSAQTTTHEQGTIGTGSEDLVLDNAVIATNQAISITTWTRIVGGA